ncbi:hypothetical protein V8E55_005002 [Tylopilus felleus]
MKIVGGQGMGDTNKGSASKEGRASQNSVASESSSPEGNEDTAKLLGRGVEMAGLRDDQYKAQSRSLHHVGIVCAPPNFKCPQSLQNLKSNGAEGRTTTTTRPPLSAIPPHSPLRPCPPYNPVPPTSLGTTPQATTFDTAVNTTALSLAVDEDDAQIILMPFHRESFGGSLTALLATLLEVETSTTRPYLFP